MRTYFVGAADVQSRASNPQDLRGRLITAVREAMGEVVAAEGEEVIKGLLDKLQPVVQRLAGDPAQLQSRVQALEERLAEIEAQTSAGAWPGESDEKRPCAQQKGNRDG